MTVEARTGRPKSRWGGPDFRRTPYPTGTGKSWGAIGADRVIKPVPFGYFANGWAKIRGHVAHRQTLPFESKARVRTLIPHRKVFSPSPRHSPANWRIYATGKTASPHGNRLSLAELLLALGATRFSRIKKSAERTDDLLRRIHSYSYVS